MVSSRFGTLLIIAWIAAAGCGGSKGPRAKFTADGYHYTRHEYLVRYSNPAEKSFLGPYWRLDSHHFVDGKLVFKTGGAYRGTTYVDWDGDGKMESRKTRFFGLKFRHRETAATIWVSTWDVPKRERRTLLDVYLGNYVESLSGTEYRPFASAVSMSAVAEKKFATTVSDRQEIVVAGKKALAATITVANLDQLRMNPDHIYSKIRIVLLRTRGTVGGAYDDGLVFGTYRGYVLMAIGYASAPEFFERGLPDFDTFLSQIEIKEPPPPSE